MRFLYGDSSPFPLDYNFLATLEVFMTAATRIVQLELEAQELAQKRTVDADLRVRGLDALDQFHAIVMRAVQDTAQKVQHAEALEYARQVGAFASRYVEEHRRETLAANDQDALRDREKTERAKKEQRVRLDGLLKAARLPSSGTQVTGRLVVEGKEARYDMSADGASPEGIRTSFTLATGSSSTWSSMRKVSDFTTDVALMVGVEKSWFRGTVSPKQIDVDDWIVTEFDLWDDAFEVSLKRKITEKDALTLRVQRTDEGLLGEAEHVGQPSLEAASGSLSSTDLQALVRLWDALAERSREVLPLREKLLSATLDERDVFEDGLVLPFVERLVGMFAPTVREIAKRSPNEFELSLKMETDGKRREEVYLRKEQLVLELQPLSSAGRAIFAPLGLDTWVPGTTAAPPPATEQPDV